MMMNRPETAAHLIEIGVHPAPGHDEGWTNGEADLTSPDGVYFNFTKDSDDIQLIVVGPMLDDPHEYGKMVGAWDTVGVKDLPPAPEMTPEQRHEVARRGFVSIILA